MAKTLVATIVSSSVSFGIYFVVAGAFFLDAYPVPSYKFEDWQLLAGIALGLFAAVLATLLATVVKLAAGMFGRLKVPAIARPLIGGLVFGIVGVILLIVWLARPGDAGPNRFGPDPVATET